MNELASGARRMVTDSPWNAHGQVAVPLAMPDATWPELPLGTNARHHLLSHGWTDADLASLRLVMSLAGRLSSLVNAVGDLGTLKSVLAAQERCDAEPTEPTAKVNGAPVLAANGPGETVHQSMVRAADSGVQVVLTLDVMGETLRHMCKVSYPIAPGYGSVFIVDPELPEQCGAVRTSVRTGDSFPHMPKVVACAPVHLAPDQFSLGFSEPAKPTLRLPPTWDGHVYAVVKGRGWTAEDTEDKPTEGSITYGDERWTEAEATVDAWEMALDNKESECARKALEYHELREALGAGREHSHEQAVAMLERLARGEKAALHGATAAEVERLRRFEDGVTDMATAHGLPHTGTDALLANLRAFIARTIAERDQATKDADDMAKIAAKQRARAAGSRELCATIMEAMDALIGADGPEVDEAIGILTRAISRHHADEPTTWPEPDCDGWYWIRANEPDSEWETTRVGRDEQTGALIATYQLVTGLSHHVVWGPRIEPPRNAASPVEVAAP